MVAILHTWGQNLSLHPHLHCIIPGGGVDYKNQWKQVPVSANGKVFLFDFESLSRVFWRKIISGSYIKPIGWSMQKNLLPVLTR
jgi:hypothetical protein